MNPFRFCGKDFFLINHKVHKAFHKVHKVFFVNLVLHFLSDLSGLKINNENIPKNNRNTLGRP
jgi:hypothetical protein